MSSPRAEYLLVTSNFPPVIGGSAVVYESICRCAGGRIGVLTARRDYRDRESFAQLAAYDATAGFPIARVKFLRPPLPTTHNRGRSKLVGYLSDLLLVVRVLRMVGWLMLKNRYRAVIIGELVYGGWIGLAARWLFRTPYVIYVHGEELTMNASGLSESLKQVYLRKASGIVAVSNYTRSLLANHFAIPPERIALVTNGVDTARFAARPPRPELLARYALSGKKVFITVGRLIPRKGVDMTLRALARVVSVETDAHYLVVGDGPMLAELKALSVELGIARHVTFCGQASERELSDHYALARFFVMPNRQTSDGDTEGFGLVFLEANACGLPVIAGRAGGAADAVDDGDNGLLVDGSDEVDIAAAILRLLRDDVLADTLRRNGLERAARSAWPARWRMLQDFLGGVEW
jgi:phosphatidylinositol alpha-1,6-mannosyltransferase